MTYGILDLKPPEKVAPAPSIPDADESAFNLLADLSDRERSIGHAFDLEPLDVTRHSIALCIGLTDTIAVFCIVPPFVSSRARYLWTRRDELVRLNSFLANLTPSTHIAQIPWPIVPPLGIGVQYLFKRSPHSGRTTAEDLYCLGTMARYYAARFSGNQPTKPVPTELETPALKPLAMSPKRQRNEDTPGLSLPH